MNFKKMATAVLALSMAASMTGVVSAADTTVSGWGDGSEIVTDGEVMNPTIAVQVPDTIGFAIDAFQKGDASGSQVFSTEFGMINKSNVAVKVTVSSKMELATGVTLVDKNKAEPTDPTNVDKTLYMEIASATALAEDATTTAAVPDAANASAAAAVAGIVGLDQGVYSSDIFAAGTTYTSAKMGTDNATMVFALNEANYVNAFADGSSTEEIFDSVAKDSGTSAITGAAAFRFMGAVNSNADWKAKDLNDATSKSDVVLKTTYNIRGLSKTAYANLITTPDTKAPNLVEKKDAAPAVSGPAFVGVADPDNITMNTAADTVIGLSMGTGASAASGIASIKVGTVTLLATEWSYSAQNSELTIKNKSVSTVANKIKGKVATINFKAPTGGGTAPTALSFTLK